MTKNKNLYNETKYIILRTVAFFSGAKSCKEIAVFSGIVTDRQPLSREKVRISMSHYSKFRHKYFNRELDTKTREYRYTLTDYGREILQKLEKKAIEGKPLKL